MGSSPKIEKQGVDIINDAYNASPQSMEAALRVLKDVNGCKRRIAVLGDMLELGDWAHNAHFNAGKLSVSLGIDYIVTVGENGRIIAEGALKSGASPDRVKSFTDNKSAIDFLRGFIESNDAILVKGSRGMGMEEIARELMR